MKDEEFLYGDMTRQIIDIVNCIWLDLGYGYPEKIYQKAIENKLKKSNIIFKREAYSKIKYDGEIIGRFYLDFLIDGKIAVEVKVRRQMYESDWIQLLNYLKANKLKVGLLMVIMKEGVKIKRVVN